MLAVSKEMACRLASANQSSLNRIRQNVVFMAYLFVERNQISHKFFQSHPARDIEPEK